MFKKKTAQEVWMRNQSRKFWKDWVCTIYILIVAACFLVVAWVEIPY